VRLVEREQQPSCSTTSVASTSPWYFASNASTSSRDRILARQQELVPASHPRGDRLREHRRPVRAPAAPASAAARRRRSLSARASAPTRAPSIPVGVAMGAAPIIA
jgi:hypothetical protein